jgi:hypothetical protein
MYSWDTKTLRINPTRWGEKVEDELSIVWIVKKESDDDESAEWVFFVEDWKLKLKDLDNKGEFTLIIKLIDWDDQYTIKEIPLTIK